MSREQARAAQMKPAIKPVDLVPVTIATVSPLKVLLPGSSTPVGGVKVAGLTYTSGAAAWALVQEPAVGPVFPAV